MQLFPSNTEYKSGKNLKSITLIAAKLIMSSDLALIDGNFINQLEYVIKKHGVGMNMTVNFATTSGFIGELKIGNVVKDGNVSVKAFLPKQPLGDLWEYKRLVDHLSSLVFEIEIHLAVANSILNKNHNNFKQNDLP